MLVIYIGAVAVLQQEDDQSVDHPVCYFSTKFDEHQKRYFTIKRETLALLLAFQQLDVYLKITVKSVVILWCL